MIIVGLFWYETILVQYPLFLIVLSVYHLERRQDMMDISIRHLMWVINREKSFAFFLFL